jgi:peptide/nickel transport system substrate-binding protein/oligopeptide transport system substrate-binding protein
MGKRLAALAAMTMLALAAGAEQELVVSLSSFGVEFNPQHSIYSTEAQVFTATYEGLFSYNPADLTPVKAAIQSYTKSKDSLTYTFYIREDASWSNGDPLLASHFRDAWLNMIEPSTGAEYAVFFEVIKGARDYRTGKLDGRGKIGITAISDRILQVRLENPAPYLTRMLCHHAFAPVHPSMLSRRKWDDPEAIPCNGPYRIASYDGESISLARNDRYWDAAAVQIPSIKILLGGESDALTRGFNNGEVHWLAGSFVAKDVLSRESFQVNPMYGTHFWYFRCDAAPFDDPDVRRALALLVPWQRIRTREVYLVPARTLILPIEGYPRVESIEERDATEARRLLEKAGYPEGKGLPTITILLPEDEESERIATILKEAWEDLDGLAVELAPTGVDRYWREAKEGDYTVAQTTWIGDFPDPIAFLSLWSSGSGLNDARYSNADYDRMLLESGALDDYSRIRKLAQAEELLLRTAVIMPISHNIAVNLLDTDYVTGWFPNALDIHPFKYLRFGTPPIPADVTMWRRCAWKAL